MADISAIQLPDGNTYNIKDDSSGYITGMTILSYGSSTWQDFLDAYNAHKVVYCRASSNSNPASGSQTRLAFMAYVNDATNPTNVEFQYYRSVNTHTASQQGDQVYVYKLDKTAGWTVTVREASVKVVAGTGLGGTYSNGTMTLTGPTISLNGSSTTSASFYAPTDAGTNGYVLKSNGSGAPTWTSAVLTDEKVKTTPTTLDVLNGYLTFSSSATETTNTLNKHSSIQIAIDADTVINGQTQLTLGNTIVEGDSGAKIGVLELYGPNQYMVRLTPDTLTDTRLIKLPNKAGTIALTSDIPTVPTIYLNDAPATLYSFYAPTTAGTSGYYLKSNGSGAPTWAAAPSGTDEKLAVSEVSTNGTYYPIFGTGTAAATRQYDTTGFSYYEYNGTTSVTGSSRIILGNNTPSQTAGNKIGSIQIYGGTAYSYTIAADTLGPLANRTLTLPDKTGTIALTSDIPTIPSNNVTGSGSTDYLARWSGTNTLSGTSLYINTSYNSSSDLYGTIKLYVGSTGQIDWRGQLVFHDGSASKTITITPPSLTASRALTLPDKDGTIALTSDIPTVPTKVSDLTNDSGYITSYTDEKVEQIPLNGLNSYKGLLFSNGQGNSQITNTVYTTDKIKWSDYERSLYIYDSTGNKYSSLSYSDIGLVGGSYTGYISFTNLSNNRNIQFPDNSGTVALTSDIPSISLNGSSTTSASFYAPTTAGTSGQVLTSSGSGAPTWQAAQSGSSVQIIRWT